MMYSGDFKKIIKVMVGLAVIMFVLSIIVMIIAGRIKQGALLFLDFQIISSIAIIGFIYTIGSLIFFVLFSRINRMSIEKNKILKKRELKIEMIFGFVFPLMPMVIIFIKNYHR